MSSEETAHRQVHVMKYLCDRFRDRAQVLLNEYREIPASDHVIRNIAAVIGLAERYAATQWDEAVRVYEEQKLALDLYCRLVEMYPPFREQGGGLFQPDGRQMSHLEQMIDLGTKLDSLYGGSQSRMLH